MEKMNLTNRQCHNRRAIGRTGKIRREGRQRDSELAFVETSSTYRHQPGHRGGVRKRAESLVSSGNRSLKGVKRKKKIITSVLIIVHQAQDECIDTLGNRSTRWALQKRKVN